MAKRGVYGESDEATFALAALRSLTGNPNAVPVSLYQEGSLPTKDEDASILTRIRTRLQNRCQQPQLG